jgi:hypothetical protein
LGALRAGGDKQAGHEQRRQRNAELHGTRLLNGRTGKGDKRNDFPNHRPQPDVAAPVGYGFMDQLFSLN